ncbi:MAG TPA: hypothetical protein VF058_01860 [Actinomycetota bacterium]
MRSLNDLLASAEGRFFLESRGVILQEAGFGRELAPPAYRGLAEALGLPDGARPVYVAHQTQVDLRRSVVCKFRAARDLRADRVEPVTLWLDTDRTGSDRALTTITWPLPEGEASVRLVPQRHRNLEPRFAPVERVRLHEVMDRLREWIGRTVAEREACAAAMGRLEILAAELPGDEPTTLARSSLAIASCLLREHLGFRSPSVFVSALAARGLLSVTVNDVLGALDEFVDVFNRSVEELVASDVDPQVHPLGDDYLPLHYACDRCGARRRLRRERTAVDQFAVMTCSCGTAHRFHLGSSDLSLGELEGSERWSADVTLPVYLNDLASGVVAGRSSVLYGLVLGEVLPKVLGRPPIPMLVPEDLAGASVPPGSPDSLLYEHLVGA